MYDARIIARFWAKVARCPHAGTCTACCWEWTAGKCRGYGLLGIYLGRDAQGKDRYQNKRANRLAWEIHNGPIPEGLHVLHTCDNPGCVNVAHLWLGSIDDNQKDSMRKGRRPTGNRHGLSIHPEARARGERMSKLTEHDIRAMRHLASIGVPHNRIGAIFNTSRANVGLIVNRKNWKHIP